MADKAQKALDQLNKFGPADQPLKFPQSRDTLAFDDSYVWGMDGIPGYQGSAHGATDTISMG